MVYVVLSVQLDVGDVTSDEAKCYRLFEVQVSRGTSLRPTIVPDIVGSIGFIQPC